MKRMLPLIGLFALVAADAAPPVHCTAALDAVATYRQVTENARRTYLQSLIAADKAEIASLDAAIKQQEQTGADPDDIAGVNTMKKDAIARLQRDSFAEAVATPAGLESAIIAQRWFRYGWIDGNSRTIEFLSEGALGVGAKDWEHSWRVEMMDGSPAVVIDGSMGTIGHFVPQPDGTLTAHLEHGGSGPISLTPIPAPAQ
jgi:hypothetical protein